ncbi:hypothetical protein ACVW0A_000158 [Pseudomonas sp. TE3610]
MDADCVGAGSARESGAAVYPQLRGELFAGRARSHNSLSLQGFVNSVS